MPWQILGLDKNTASERDVKRAYARLLKKHRPDDDPEGFKNLHRTYEQAKAELRAKAFEETTEGSIISLLRNRTETVKVDSMSTLSDRSENSMDQMGALSFVDSASDLPEEIRLEIEELDKVSDSKDTDKVVGRTVSRLLDATKSNPLFLNYVDNYLAERFEELKPPLKKYFNADTFVRFLENDASNTAFRLAECYTQEENYNKLEEIGIRVKARLERLKNPDAAHFIAQLAGVIAITNYQRSKELGNFAYEHLPVDLRDWRLQSWDRWSKFGFAVRRLDLQDRVRWNYILRSGGKEIDWSERNYQRLLRRTGSASDESVRVLQPYLPAEAWERILQKSGRSKFRKRQETEESFNWFSLIWIFFLLGIMGKYLGQCRESASRSNFYNSKARQELQERYKLEFIDGLDADGDTLKLGPGSELRKLLEENDQLREEFNLVAPESDLLNFDFDSSPESIFELQESLRRGEESIELLDESSKEVIETPDDV